MHEDILKAFSLPAPRAVRPVGGGLMNTTYRVETEKGDFTLQRLHDVVPDVAVEDMDRVTKILANEGLVVPSLLRTERGDFLARDAEGGRWRLYPWLQGSVFDTVTDGETGKSAGNVLGRVHRSLARLEERPRGSIPHFHDTKHILSELEIVRQDLPEEVQDIADRIVRELPALIVTDEAGPFQTVHGDPKISNVLFDEKGSACGMLDFDTLLWHSRGIDMGDALRSWCNGTSEDDPEASFAEDLFERIAEGYAEGFGTALTDQERALYRRAAKHIAYELAARFLIDVVRDCYFGYDEVRYPNRRAHNIARAKGQFALGKSIVF